MNAKKKRIRVSVGAGQATKKAQVKDTETLLDANSFESSEITKKQPLTLSVDHSKPLRARIAAGRYTDLSKGILSESPSRKNGRREYEARIFHFDEIISSQGAKKKIEQADKRLPWKVAPVDQLVALGNLLPHLQRQFPIVALGTVFKKGPVPQVACLHHGDGLKRYIVLRWIGDDWCGDFAFLAIRAKIQD
jgi:hypothetical protein